MPGYTLSGSTITLTGDDGDHHGAGTNNTTSNVGGGTHTIASVLAGSAGMNKAGGGTLILTNANSYTGGTTVGGGTLQIANGGSIIGDVTTSPIWRSATPIRSPSAAIFRAPAA